MIEIGLWLLFTDTFPAILWRDARLTAALVLGQQALIPSTTFDWSAMAVATLIHFGLSAIYGVLMCTIVHSLNGFKAIGVGALLGLALYIVNLHGFTLLFPWFEAARGWITLIAHLTFGVTATAVGLGWYGKHPTHATK